MERSQTKEPGSIQLSTWRDSSPPSAEGDPTHLEVIGIILGAIAAIATGLTLADKFNVFGTNPEQLWWWERLPIPTSQLPPATFKPPPEYVPPPTPTVRAETPKMYEITASEVRRPALEGWRVVFPLEGEIKDEEVDYEYPETYPAIRPP